MSDSYNPTGFSRLEYWSGLPFPSPGDLNDPGTEPESLGLQSNLLPSELPWNCMLLLSHFSRVQPCVTPWTAAHQAPPSLGFSRQKHWSGLPFPSPMRESEVSQSCPNCINHIKQKEKKTEHIVNTEAGEIHGGGSLNVLHLT